MPSASLAAIRRILWLEDELVSCPAEELDTLDGAMRVLDAAYGALELAVLRTPRGHPVREAALRLVGARRVWLAIAAETRPGNEEPEREASHELELARGELRRVYAALVRSAPRSPSHGRVGNRVGGAVGSAAGGGVGSSVGGTAGVGSSVGGTAGVASNVVSLASRRRTS